MGMPRRYMQEETTAGSMGDTEKLVDDEEVVLDKLGGLSLDPGQEVDIYAISLLSSSPHTATAVPAEEPGDIGSSNADGSSDYKKASDEVGSEKVEPLIDIEDSPQPSTPVDNAIVPDETPDLLSLYISTANTVSDLQEGVSDPKTEGVERREYLRRLHQPRAQSSASAPSLGLTSSTPYASSPACSAGHTPFFTYSAEIFPRPRQPVLDTTSLPLKPSTPTPRHRRDVKSLPPKPATFSSSSESTQAGKAKSRLDVLPRPPPGPSSRPGSSRSRSPLKDAADPLASAYKQTNITPSTRLTVPDVLVYPHPADDLQTALMQSWRSSGIHSDPSRKAQLEAFINRLNDIVNQTFDKRFVSESRARKPPNRYRVEPFGSVSWDGTTGFGDLDLVIIDTKLPRGYEPRVWRQLPGMPDPPPLPEAAKGKKRNKYVQPNSKVPALYNVDRLAACLRQAGMKQVMPIKWASVPIVKFVEPTHGWQCDINVNELGGWFNSQLILAYCNVNPHLVRPYIHTLKLWAANRCINDPAGANGLITLSSYALTIMAIAYLQIRGCLPNLQDCTADEIQAIGGEQHNVVFVDWQNNQGTPIVCCFNRRPRPDWRSREPNLTAADAVRGFFEYFSTKGRVEHYLGRFDYANQALSVLHGGQLARVQTRRPPQPGVSAHEERLLVGDAGRGVQPRVWFDNRFVIQDPFIFMKSVTRSINKNGFNAISQEIDRAHAKLAARGHDDFWYLCEDAYA